MAQPLLIGSITMQLRLRLSRLPGLRGLDFGLAFALGVMVAMFTG